MIYIVDIDNTICVTEPDKFGKQDYENSTPIQDRIDYVNRLWEQGHVIHYWTARGSSSGIDWVDFTKSQLDKWGCKYHTVKCGKPSYDVWIDDKAINARDIPPVF
jgi:hypothetical protein